MPDLTEAEALRKAQSEEWGQFVAVAPIDYDGVRAYNVGDPVPATNVQQYGYLADGLVAKTSTKAAAAAVEQAAPSVPTVTQGS